MSEFFTVPNADMPQPPENTGKPGDGTILASFPVSAVPAFVGRVLPRVGAAPGQASWGFGTDTSRVGEAIAERNQMLSRRVIILLVMTGLVAMFVLGAVSMYSSLRYTNQADIKQNISGSTDLQI